MLTRPRQSAAAFAGALLSIFSVVCGASTAWAQVNYTEPPDLGGVESIATPVGTIGLGLNTIRGTIQNTANNGVSSGEVGDFATFTVPAGMVVTRVEVVITNFTRTASIISRFQSFNSELQNWFNFGANGTSPNMISTANGALAPGTYSLGVTASAQPGATGLISYTWEMRITAAVNSNDTCQLATAINLGATPFDNTTATTDGVAHVAACNFSSRPTIAKDLWYAFTPTLSGALTVSTCGSTFDTEVNVYNGGTGICPGSDATLLACNDDNGAACGTGSLQSQVVVTVVAGQPYIIRVGSFDAVTPTSGAGTLTLSQVTTGACCNRWTGNCVVDTQADCAARGLRFDGFGVACSPTTCKACAADFDGSGGRDVSDIFSFLSAWFAGCP